MAGKSPHMYAHDRLREAALDYANADTDQDFDLAWGRLTKAALAYQRAPRKRGRPRRMTKGEV